MKYLFCIPVFLLIFSCEKGPGDELLIDSLVEVEMAEAAVGGGEQVVLHCKTLKEYICYDYVIGYDRNGDGDVIRIDFQHIAPGASQQCASAVGPARASINLGNLENGEYAIELNNGKQLNKGTLEVSDKELILNFPKQTGIDILTPVVLR
ncbi:hypothetical protein [Cesiribacter sp. SM1]|uniref:hypothetical protein n=1 Tax=Cesiribacter sp. SM1 TaxID=2861196 RepID=UPI001CD5EE6E|nr:hypothetical protein [Cesiribacter sp. SM1]